MNASASDAGKAATRVAKTSLRIRRPAAEVFEAFVDPEITTKFWFTHGSGRLEESAHVHWEWEMFGLVVPVRAVSVDAPTRLVIEWGDQDDPPRRVEWTFMSEAEGATYVEVVESGFDGEGEALVDQVLDSVRGFTLVLTGAKAFLEHGVGLNVVVDSHPLPKDG